LLDWQAQPLDVGLQQGSRLIIDGDESHGRAQSCLVLTEWRMATIRLR
jgi:hypothetical protein